MKNRITIAGIMSGVLFCVSAHSMRPMDESASRFTNEPDQVQNMTLEDVQFLTNEVHVAVHLALESRLTHKDLENALAAMSLISNGSYPKRYTYIFEAAVTGYEQVTNEEFVTRLTPWISKTLIQFASSSVQTGSCGPFLR